MKYLVGTGGVHNKQEIPLDSEVIIGRDTSICQLIYPSNDKGISGVHCKVKCVADTVQLVDMGSTNGTFLDSGIRLTPNVPQVLEVGKGFYLADHGNSYIIKDDENESKGKQNKSTANDSGRNVNAANRGASGQGAAGAPGRGGSMGFAIACFVVGIVALLLGLLAFFKSLTYIPAIVLGVISIGFAITALMVKSKGLAMTIVGLVCSSITVLGLVSLLVYGMLQPPKGIEGTWYLSDSTEVRGALIEALEAGMEKIEMDPRLAEVLVDETNVQDGIIFTFSDTGNIYLANPAGLNITLGIITWEDTQDDHIRIAMDLKDVEVFGNSVPIEIGYRAKYSIKGDIMTLDFFGAEVTLERQKESEGTK